MGNTFESKNIHISNTDAMKVYDKWEAPIVIISDGPYGISGFKGDLSTPDNLGEWYRPHIEKWTERSSPQTTLWFWNTEIGWAKVHPVLEDFGWKYVNCHIWDKGIGHVAGNSNTKSLRKLPVVTEVCVQYVKEAQFKVAGKKLPVKDWLRYEWERTGLPFSNTNEAAGVKNAATRKYFTKDYLWYMPPPDIFERISKYANTHGKKKGAPYFSVDGKHPLSEEEWSKMRSKFYCPFGVTNVWNHPPLNGEERIKYGIKSVHLNQKPLKFMELIIKISSDPEDVVWEPFGGLISGAIAASKLKRKCFAAEINTFIFEKAIERIKKDLNKPNDLSLTAFQ